MLSKLAFTFYMVVHRGLLYSFPQVAQLVKIRLHMQALSLNCNLIFCSAGQHDHDLSLCLPNPPPPPPHTRLHITHGPIIVIRMWCVSSRPLLPISTQSLR